MDTYKKVVYNKELFSYKNKNNKNFTCMSVKQEIPGACLQLGGLRSLAAASALSLACIVCVQHRLPRAAIASLLNFLLTYHCN